MSRLLWITENFPPRLGGMAESCDRIVRSLRETDLQIDVLHFSEKALTFSSNNKQGGKLIICPLEDDPAHAMNVAWTHITAEGLRENWTHCVAFGGLIPMLSASVYAAWLHIPLYTLLRGNDFDISIFTPKRRDILDDTLRRSSKVLTVTCDMQEKIKALYPNQDCQVIANGINTDNWSPLQSDRTLAKTFKSDNAHGKTVLGIFGHIKKKKGVALVLESLLSSGLVADYHLLMVGDMEPGIKAILDEYQTLFSYSELPFMDRFSLIPYYLACDYMLLSSYYDGLPNVMLESAALGVPFLAAKAGGMADWLEDDKHGFMFNPGHQAEIIIALKKALEVNDEQKIRMSQACQALIEERLHSRFEKQAYLKIFTDN